MGDGFEINWCRPIYKHGQEYLLAMLYMLAYPYGDAVRLMSSYAFTDHRHGPPGVSNGSIQEATASVYSDGVPRGCRVTPDTAPVTAEYDDDKVAPWVCEHRWQGVA